MRGRDRGSWQPPPKHACSPVIDQSVLLGRPNQDERVHLFYGQWYYVNRIVHIALELALKSEGLTRKIDRVDNCSAVLHRHRFNAEMDPRDNYGEVEELYEQTAYMHDEMLETFDNYLRLYTDSWEEILRRWKR